MNDDRIDLSCLIERPIPALGATDRHHRGASCGRMASAGHGPRTDGRLGAPSARPRRWSGCLVWLPALLSIEGPAHPETTSADRVLSGLDSTHSPGSAWDDLDVLEGIDGKPDRAVRRASRLSALVTAALFVAGGVTGGLVCTIWWPAPVWLMHPPPPPGLMPLDQLDLSADQQQKAHEIGRRHHPELEAIRKESAPRVRACAGKDGARAAPGADSRPARALRSIERAVEATTRATRRSPSTTASLTFCPAHLSPLPRPGPPPTGDSR